MKTFDIDKFTPDYKPPFVLRKRATKADKLMIAKASRIHLAQLSYRNGTFGTPPPGVEPKKVLDWRSLERRASEISAMWEAANKKFWDSVREARKAKCLADDEELYIFIDQEWIIKCHADGFSSEKAEYIAGELVEGKRHGIKFFVMKYDEGGSEIGRLNRRSNLLLRCMGIYERTLERALRDRLQVYLDSIRDVKAHRSYFPPQIYLIENEGRVRVAQSDSLGRLSWINGEIAEA